MNVLTQCLTLTTVVAAQFSAKDRTAMLFLAFGMLAANKVLAKSILALRGTDSPMTANLVLRPKRFSDLVSHRLS